MTGSWDLGLGHTDSAYPEPSLIRATWLSPNEDPPSPFFPFWPRASTYPPLICVHISICGFMSVFLKFVKVELTPCPGILLYFLCPMTLALSSWALQGHRDTVSSAPAKTSDFGVRWALPTQC